MLPKQSNSVLYKKHSITTLLGVVMLLSFISCGGKKANVGEAITERDSLPLMTTHGMEMFVSDSGIVRYRIVAEKHEMFDKKNPSYSIFEKGAYLEKFDTLFNVEATIKADTVYNYDKKGLWILKKNVHIENTLGEKFDTELLYWDQNAERVYSDKYIRIEQADRIITGYGFESNQQMTKYNILDISGIFYIENMESN
ncbi:LPS export ABC transporter periplasmic protein LptC [Bacteroides sp. 519]|uniref:LPS export ABC transporter periplasmic protein LptC n=1 Tax=Bacteroides sp. 519 TaxID=2302937 RepID=UPI0013D8BC7C|nr:LPS export ABC transporter periplasmic protein LptC [Bacteroides sp. 519]NDV58664.1 LPS export ABC transporter periplasmic protein LptC [Bacteroides sp. 519]